MSDLSPKIYTFGPFRIDFDQRRLFRAGDSVPLTPKAFDTLAILVERQGRIVEKAELLKLVWPDTFVEENNLTQNISALRKAFGDQGYIETIPRRGYRFMIGVEAVSASDARPHAQTEPVAPGRRFPFIWIGAVLAVTVAAGLGFFAVNRISGTRHLSYRVDSLVVLPFVNLTASPEDEYFSDGLTEEVTNAAAHLDGLRVVARTTAFQFKGKAKDIRSIAKQLQVTTVLEGSVRRQEKKLRVTVQLNDAESGYHIWSQTYDRDLGDMFTIQEDISSQVARTIRPDGRTVHAVPGSKDREAYNLYLLGRFHRTQPDQASVRRAIAFFEQATGKDPGYAAAYAGLAECYVKLAQGNFVAPVEAWAAAQKVVDKALALDDRLAEAHTTQAIIRLLMDRNWEASEAEFRRAIALNPNDAAAHHWFSHYFTVMGRVSESLAESRTALMLSPLDVQISSHLISNYVRARDFPSAIHAGLETLELDAHSQLAYLFLMWAYEDTEQWDKAIDASQRAGKAHPEESALRAAVHSEGARGYWRVTQAVLAKQEKPDNFRLAVCYARLGEADNSLARLEQAFQKREPESLYVKSEPAFDWMRSNPRFRALTAAIKLP
jgi:TolB-like protein/DNA-binding winged helix-turn-helix (wHTH) protein/tetratricopeptide (TPR) repeat protein